MQTICPLSVDNMSSSGTCKTQRTFTRVEKGDVMLLLPSALHNSFKVLKLGKIRYTLKSCGLISVKLTFKKIIAVKQIIC